MAEPQPPSNKRYEAVFGLAPGKERQQLRRRLGRRIERLGRESQVSNTVERLPLHLLQLASALEACELWEALADPSESYTWHMPLTPEEGAAIERGPRGQV